MINNYKQVKDELNQRITELKDLQISLDSVSEEDKLWCEYQDEIEDMTYVLEILKIYNE